MIKVEDIQQYGKEHFETVVASATTVQKGLQAIASAYGDYTKKSFEDTKSFVEKLSGVKSLDKAIEVQTEYAKSAYETFVAESQKIAGPLHRSRQADLQAASKAWSRSSRRPRPPDHRACSLSRISSGRTAHQLSKIKSPAVTAGLFLGVRRCRDYRATRSFESAVPIELNVVAIWVELVSM